MRTRSSILAGIAVLGLLALGCSPDRATGPADAPVPAPSSLLGLTSGSLLSPSTVTVPMVRRLEPLASDITVTRTIGPLGGVIAIPQAGLVVTFLPGAVLSNTSITATAYAGSYVSYGFGPHGLKFLTPVLVSQDLSMTTVTDPGAVLYGGYTPDGQKDLLQNGTAIVSELLSVRLTLINILGKAHLTSLFTIQHFSGYILAGGRSEQ